MQLPAWNYTDLHIFVVNMLICGICSSALIDSAIASVVQKLFQHNQQFLMINRRSAEKKLFSHHATNRVAMTHEWIPFWL